MKVPLPDIATAAAAVSVLDSIVEQATAHLSAHPLPTTSVVPLDVAFAASSAAVARAAVAYGAGGTVELGVACGFVSEATAGLGSRLLGRDRLWGFEPGLLAQNRAFMMAARHPDVFCAHAVEDAPRTLPSTLAHHQQQVRALAERMRSRVGDDPARIDIVDAVSRGLEEIAISAGDDRYPALVVSIEELSRVALAMCEPLLTETRNAGDAARWLGLASAAVGIMQSAYEDACRDVTESVVSAKPPSEQQSTLQRLARMRVTTIAVRQYVGSVASTMKTKDALLDAAMAVLYAREVIETVVLLGMQVHGASPFSNGQIYQAFLDARSLAAANEAERAAEFVAGRLFGSARVPA